MRTALAEGWSHLTEGRWDAAKAAFGDAARAEESPEAYEGLSWAAWWLDDAEQVFSARERAYRLYKDRGDVASAARLATWLASDQLDFHGASSVANGWLQRARRLLDGVEDGPERGWLAFHEGYVANLSGDAATARTLALSAADAGRRFGVPDLEMLGLALEGAALVSCARVEEGMKCLDEATVAALGDEAEIPISGAWACCFLVTSCAAVLDYERAYEWCDRIAEFAERYGSRYMLAFCRAEYGAVHLWRGSWDEAESVLSASIDDFSSSRPAMTGAPLAVLAELRRRQGRPEEAEAMLDRAGDFPRAQVVRAQLLVDSGRPAEAAQLLERILRQIPEDRLLDRVPALELLVHARLAAGSPDEAAECLGALRDAGDRAGTAAMRACVGLASGAVAAAAGDYERARTLLEDAVDGFVACGSPFDAARARLALARTLSSLGRTDAAVSEAGRALESFVALGAAAQASGARTLMESWRRPADEGPPVTPRELDVLRLVAEGMTNRQIADRLVVSEHTVHRHVTNMLRKLGLPSRTAAAAYAVRAGIADTTDE